MPRSSRSGGGARPSAGRPSSSSSFGQPAGAQRGASTMAAPPPTYSQQQQHHAAAPPAGAAAQPRQPGMFANMASTAAGVAVGSSVGHGISNMLFGGRSEAAPQEGAPLQSQAWDGQQQQAQQNSGINCEVQSKDFLRCLDASNNDMQSCSYYLDQLKACQAAARPY